MSQSLKLNLGCGQNSIPGYVNVDKFGQPDVLCDLEVFPWPWEDSSVDEIILNHVLEHLGETKDVFLGIMKELYRVCKPNASIKIAVPHPRHDYFINDPTHVRAVTPDVLGLFSQKNNLEWAKLGGANSPLGLYINVDFEIVQTNYVLDEPWLSQFNAGEISNTELWQSIRQFNNVVSQIEIELRVVKDLK